MVAAATLTGCAAARQGPVLAPSPMVAARAAAGPSVFWNSATVYFLLTDRFRNGNPANDTALGRGKDGGLLRSFEGGDLKGLLSVIDAGYFDSLGVDAIWMTPFVEQIRGSVDEGSGRTYGFHGYWARDWSAVDPALGTKADLHAVVDAAHRHGIRVLMDAVINHTGPVTPLDPAWPSDWIRTGPNCTYRDYTTTTACTLVSTLPDLLTESDQPVDLPPFLRAKWTHEGRLGAETASLDAFFARTGWPRAPRYYVIKWLTDWVREFGIDGYRVDTAKHFGESVSLDLKHEAERALADWRQAHPSAERSLPFYMVGEVYGWSPGEARTYSFGDRAVDYFANGYDGLINFAFKADAGGDPDALYRRYSHALQAGPLSGVSILNYISSHDDGAPLDPDRKHPMQAGTALLLSPGAAQVYYGDELARPLRIRGAAGDANLRSAMNWGDRSPGMAAEAVLRHWRLVGRFRQAHPAIGAGEHETLQANPLIFSRTLRLGAMTDRVLVATGQVHGRKTVPVYGTFAEGSVLLEAYSGTRVTVRGDAVTLDTDSDLVLLAPTP